MMVLRLITPIQYHLPRADVRGFVVLLSMVMALSIPLNACSAEMTNLYQGKAAVIDSTPEQRNEAIKRALKNVLSRLLSRQMLANSKAIENILGEASQYVRQFRFESAQATPSDQSGDSPKVLIVNFDPFALSSALTSNGFKVWGTKRPEILLWLAVKEESLPRMFAPDGMPELESELRNAAEYKGLPLLFPLMDLTDHQQLTVDDVWMGFDDRIRQASDRYDVSYILAGRLSRKIRQWEMEWKFFQRDTIDEWQSASSTLSQTLQTGIERIFEQLIAVYAPDRSNTNQSGIRIKISGITNLNDVKRVADYLKSLSPVHAIEWLAIEPDSVLFRLTIDGDEKRVKQLLSTEQELLPEVTDDVSNVIHYRLLP